MMEIFCNKKIDRLKLIYTCPCNSKVEEKKETYTVYIL